MICRLTILVGEDDQWHHHATYHEIVRRAHSAGLAGATVFRGVEGYGATHHIHTTRILSLSEDLPVAVVIIDDEQRLREFAAGLNDLGLEGVATLEPVEVLDLGGGHG